VLLQKKCTPLLQEVKHFVQSYPAYSAYRGLVRTNTAMPAAAALQRGRAAGCQTQKYFLNGVSGAVQSSV
jgi:hypothetical protein